MPYRAEMLISSTKFVCALLGVSGLWFADTVANFDNWWERYGLTGLVIAALAWVVKLQWSTDQKARAEALAAKDALVVAAQANAALHLATTKELIDATNHQTTELTKFTEKLMSMDAKVSACAANQFPYKRNQPEKTGA